MRIVVAGGGWAGCAAAAAAAKRGADVVLCERTDLLLGTGLSGGIMRNNGRDTAAEELLALGGGELIAAADLCARHRNVDFPGHSHATLYDTSRMPVAVENLLRAMRVEIRFETRITRVNARGGRIASVVSQKGEEFAAEAFIDATGSAGPQANCAKYGSGCAMCALRCPSYGPRVSLCALAGVRESPCVRADGGTGAVSGSCKLDKASLAPSLRDALDARGVCITPLPAELIRDKLGVKACRQYALDAYRDNLILLDTGSAKLMSPWMPLADLHRVPGFENARYEEPLAGGRGNSVRLLAAVARDDAMRVLGTANLFCAGEKAGMLVGHTEAIVTGTIAGYNAVRLLQNLPLTALPRSLACGDAVAYARETFPNVRVTFSGAEYFERMKENGLYTTDRSEVRRRVAKAGLSNVFAR